MSVSVLDSLATTEPLADIFSDANLLRSMLRFEVALARAEARQQLIPATAAEQIEAAATDATFDAAAIARDARASGTIAIPFVAALTARVRDADPPSATFVHWGATSQDVTDTAMVLCLAQAFPIVAADHRALALRLRALSDQHATAVMLGRTLMQPALPITFGLKVAGWWAACERCWVRVAAAFSEGLVLQFGGPSGTLAALGTAGSAVAGAMARELSLANAYAPWHAHRDRLGTMMAACGVYTATLGKIARDVTLLMQSEVAEVSEPGGNSSAMPHKRNPSGSAIALAAAARVPGLVSTFLTASIQEHERGVGGWHAEAPTVAAIVQATGAAVASMRNVVEQLRVDTDRMRANIAATRGVVFAERAMVLLTPRLGRETAQQLIAHALEPQTRGSRTFTETLAAMPEVASVLTPHELSTLDVPETYLGCAEVMRRHLLGIEEE